MFRSKVLRLAIPLLLIVFGSIEAMAGPYVRIKDLTEVEGVRSNPLIGYGLVVGLEGTGDGTQARFTVQSLANLLRRSGVSIPAALIRVRNVAAVMVTADLPPFARPSQPIDVSVSSIGDAKSLVGGTLLMTPLQGPDGNTYAVAQGAVSLGGAFTAGGGGTSVVKNHPTAGIIPGGAIVERQVPLSLFEFEEFRLLLTEADFTTSARISEAINHNIEGVQAVAEDSGAVRIVPTSEIASPVAKLAAILEISVRPDKSARVVVNERTGTVVMGQEVRVSSIALAHGSLTIQIGTQFDVSQPMPFSERGQTKVVPDRDVEVEEGTGEVLSLDDGISVHQLIEALNTIGASPRDMIAILEAMRAAGALHAELVVL